MSSRRGAANLATQLALDRPTLNIKNQGLANDLAVEKPKVYKRTKIEHMIPHVERTANQRSMSFNWNNESVKWKIVINEMKTEREMINKQWSIITKNRHSPEPKPQSPVKCSVLSRGWYIWKKKYKTTPQKSLIIVLKNHKDKQTSFWTHFYTETIILIFIHRQR